MMKKRNIMQTLDLDGNLKSFEIKDNTLKSYEIKENDDIKQDRNIF